MQPYSVNIMQTCSRDRLSEKVGSHNVKKSTRVYMYMYANMFTQNMERCKDY